VLHERAHEGEPRPAVAPQAGHGGADVVPEARQRDLGGTCAAPEEGRPFVHLDRHPGPRERHGGGEPVGAGTNDNRPVGHGATDLLFTSV